MIKHLNNNGVKLAYSEAGHGDESMLLIHGWTDNHHTLAALTAHFEQRYRVIAADLRGHGGSDKPQTGYGIAEMADELVWLCDQLSLLQPILIGHSLGGSIGLEMAARHPNLPAAIVALDGVIVPPQPVLDAMAPLGEALRSPAWFEAMHGFVESGFLPTDDAELRHRAHAELERLPQHVHIGVFDGMLAWDAVAAARACNAPFLYVESGNGLSDLRHLAQLCPHLMTGRTVGVGHNQMVATPQQVIAMIERFIALAQIEHTVDPA
jgi:pimeloyl-ACP methyl ester carboxylesterase